MSLDWSVENVLDFENRCYRPSPFSEDKGHGRVVLQVDTEALVHGAMQVDIGGIRTINVNEWHFRIEYLKRVGINWLTKWDGEKSVPVWPTYDAICDHIGLRTNVATTARQKWIRKVARYLERETEEAIQREISKREKDS